MQFQILIVSERFRQFVMYEVTITSTFYGSIHNLYCNIGTVSDVYSDDFMIVLWDLGAYGTTFQ